MTIEEQIIAIREEMCDYACRYKKRLEDEHKDPIVAKAYLQEYCQGCPMNRLARCYSGR